tara:strand:- start:2597 stop:5122 length:2526 start_codon:yes stop_codon:yes gene_type:complete
MANPVYPASNNAEAIALNISNANQFYTVLQGSIDDFIPTYEGNGEIPSVAKALNEAAAYRVPLPWETSGQETDLMQPYEYNGNVYVPISVPAPFSAAPDNNFWRLYSQKTAQILIDNLTFDGDGVTTDFSIPSAVVDDPAAYFVSIDGVDQRPTIDYTVNVGTDTLSFTSAPPSGTDNISITILGALKGALSEGIYETTSDGLDATVDGGFFNVVNTTDPEAFIDLYKNNGGSALLIDTYPNSVAYNNLANAVAYEADLADNSVGNGSDKLAHTGTNDTVTEALDKNIIDISNRVIRATSVAEIESYSVGAGYVFILSAGGQSGVFDVVSGDFSTELAADTFNGVYIGLSDDPTAATKVARRRERKCLTPEMFTAVGDGVSDDTEKVRAAIDFTEGKVEGALGSTYLCTSQIDITSTGVEFDLNGSTLDFQFTSQQAGVYVKADDVEVHNGSILVTGSGGAETGGNGHSLNCVTSGVQGDGSGWSGLHVHHLYVTTNRTDAGSHIGLLGENTNFHIHDIEVPDNAVCRNIIGCEWGGTQVGGTGHPHNGRIENIHIGNITTPTYGGSGYAYAVWLSAAFNIHVENITMGTGYGLLMATRGDNANTYAPARYKSLVGTGITFDNLTINSCYGYGLRVIGSNRSATLDNIPMSVKGRNLTVVGGKVGANNNFGMNFEQCADVSIQGINISGAIAAGSSTGTAVDRLHLRYGQIADAELFGASLGSGAVKTRDSSIRDIKFVRNNANAGGLPSTAAIYIQASEGCAVTECTFGEEGGAETQKYSIAVTADAARPWLQNNYTWGLAASGVAYHNPSSTDASGFNNFAAAGLTVTSGTWVTPVATA